MIKKICSCGEGVPPVLEIHGDLGQQSETHINNTLMLPLNLFLLVMGVGTRVPNCNAMLLKKRRHPSLFTSKISLETFELCI